MGRIVVTGMGVITALGDSVAENREALKAGRCGMSSLEHTPTRYANLLPFGEIKKSNETLRDATNAYDTSYTRTDLLALHAFKEAIKNSGLSESLLQSQDTAFINASTVGGMCLTDEMFLDANLKSGGSAYLSSYHFAAPTFCIQQRYQLRGHINTINTACSSSANAIQLGARLIQQGLAKRAIVGGVDSLAKFTINGFHALQIVSPEICTPFDAGRQGLNLGEGAAFLVLEKEEDSASKSCYAALSGYSNTNDAFHPSSLSETGDGPFLAMQEALLLAGLQAEDIDFVNAHGTATENNDLAESAAMTRLFQNVPDFASTKSNTGHTLGAAGAIEAVYSILNLYHQEVYPSLNFTKPIEPFGLKPVQAYTPKALKHVLSNSFGFGGNCSSLLFSRI